MISTKHNSYAIQELCGLFGKSRQGYYDLLKMRRSYTKSTDEELILHHIRERRKDLPKEGVRKLMHELQPVLALEGIYIGRDKLFDLLRLHGMLQKRKYVKVQLTNSNHTFKIYPNLIVDKPEPEEAGLVWASDMTYIRINTTFSYLSLVTDHYDHQIVGHYLSEDLKTKGPLNALNMALVKRIVKSEKLIHHSDRGCQYCSHLYTDKLKENFIEISMTRGGEPTANAIAERVNGILKHELGLNETFKSFEEAKAAVEKAISIYNTKRPHASLNYMTPISASSLKGSIKKRWKQNEKQSIIV